MENLDLNIHNYELNDLLALFKLPFHFDDSDLKNAKRIVLKTHPDKSGLDKESRPISFNQECSGPTPG